MSNDIDILEYGQAWLAIHFLAQQEPMRRWNDYNRLGPRVQQHKHVEEKLTGRIDSMLEFL
jgi:hypothetical protein